MADTRAVVQYVDVVLNPHSRKNRGRDRTAKLGRILGPRGVVHVTRGTAELGPLLERVLDRDLACLVSDGGDGALHWALNAALPICERRSVPLPVVLPTNGGTIDFVARKAGVRGHADEIVARLVAALERGPLPVVELPSLEVSGRLASGLPFRRVGFALAAGGIGNRFFEKYYEDPAPQARTIVEVVARAVGSLAIGGRYAQEIFAPHRARVSIDGVPVAGLEQRALHAGAFEVDLGGVFRVFPLAGHGKLHFQAGAIRPIEMVRNLPRLARGAAILSPHLRDVAGEVMEIEVPDDEEALRPILDGELQEPVRAAVVRAGPTVRVARV